MGEVQIAALLCAMLAGSEEETRQYFDVNGMKRHVRADCETADHVIEIGLDGKSSARDSLHQALFSAHLSGKTPAVVLIDRDGYEGRFEYEMRQVTKAAGVAYMRCGKAFLLRWAETAPMRPGFADASTDDLPREASVKSRCDLDALATGGRKAGS